MTILLWLASALFLTATIEFAAYLLLLERSPESLLLCSLAVNGLTNPLLNYLYLFEVHDLFLLEASAALAESLLIMALLKVSYPRALMVSAAANLASALTGWLLMPFLIRL